MNFTFTSSVRVVLLLLKHLIIFDISYGVAGDEKRDLEHFEKFFEVYC